MHILLPKQFLNRRTISPSQDFQRKTLDLYNKFESDGEPNAFQSLQNRLNIRGLDNKELAILQWQSEFPKAAKILEELTELHRKLVFSKVKVFSNRNPSIEFDDLLRVAKIALVISVSRYNSAYGTVFSTYAQPTIHGILQRFQKSQTKDTKNRTTSEILLHIPNKEIDPTRSVELKEARETQSIAHGILSKLLATDLFNDRERHIIDAYYSGQEVSTKELEEQFSISKQRIYQIKQKALEKLSRAFRDSAPAIHSKLKQESIE